MQVQRLGGRGAGNPSNGSGGLLVLYVGNLNGVGEVVSTGSNGASGNTAGAGSRRRINKYIF